jgi:hypothetical protein
MDEWATEAPHSPGGVLAYVELAAIIVSDEIGSYWEAAQRAPVLSERDLGYAALLRASTRRWLNGLDVEEAVQQERAARNAERTEIIERTLR